MKIILTIFCLFLFSTSILAENWKLNTSKPAQATSIWKLHTSVKNDYHLRTLPNFLDHKNRQELSHIIPRNILASVSYTTKNVSMESGNQFSQANCVQRASMCSQAQQAACSYWSRPEAFAQATACQRARQAACSRQNSNDRWFLGKLLIQNRNARMEARANSYF